MNELWTYFWPAFAAGVVAGIIAGLVFFRSGSRRNLVLAAGVAAAVAMAALWHGPLGAAERFSAEIDRIVRLTLDHYEMSQVQARLHRDPLTRRLILSGPADDFQTTELVRLFGQLPSISRAQWTADRPGVPLIAEAAGVAILGFLVGLFLAYLRALHRRHNSQWNW